MAQRADVRIHPTAEVSTEAVVGDGTSIWNQAQVREGARIGSGCIIGKNVYVDAGVVIGDRVKVQNNVSVFHGVTIEDGVFVGPHVCFTNDRVPRAINVDGSLKADTDWEVSPILVRHGAALGANSTILPGVTIGRWGMVGAGSVVTRDVDDHELVAGNPARRLGSACPCGQPLRDDPRRDAVPRPLSGVRRALPAGDRRVRVLTVVGARPQFVKAAPVSRVLRRSHDEVLVHTGQHYDEEMSAAFFRDLELPEPDVNLAVGSGTHGVQTGEMLRRLEPVVLEHAPDGVLVYGDTNSTLAGAIVAAKVAFADGRRPWLAHVEAGLRSFNPRMPEERNRVVADHLADACLAPTATAIDNLAREGLAARSELVGDVMVDAHTWAAERAGDHLPEVAHGIGPFVLLTLHRAENVDDADRLGRILDGLATLELPVVFPVHPRTRAAIERGAHRLPSNVRPIDPVGFLAMVALEASAAAIATDSGGLQKEAYLAGVPCVTLRGETEWVETVEAGWNRVVDADSAALATAIADPGFMDRARPRPALYGDGRAAEHIVAALERLDAAHPNPLAADHTPQEGSTP
jgi:UDP-N-acetylglucosamine 2-epimerase